MSARSRRKRYTPRRVDPRGGLGAIERRQPLAEDEVGKIATMARIAFERVRTGQGDLEDLLSLGFASNVALLFAEGGIGPECEPEIKAAQAALLRANERLEKHGRAGLDGPGLTAVAELLEIYDAQLEEAMVGDMVAVLREVNKRVELGLVANRTAEFREEASA